MRAELDPLQIAIDGPAGSGKSSVAARVAEALGLVHVDTGAMYRGVTLLALRESIAIDDGEALATRLESAAMRFVGGRLHIDEEDVGAAIREVGVTAKVSEVSAHAAVRRAMVRRQRCICWESEAGALLEGRDIGSVVLPLSRCKIYLDATPEERARRRAHQQGLGEDPSTLERVREDIVRRDAYDSEREFSPLKISPDAHVIDTTAMDLDAVISRCVELGEAARNPFDDAAAVKRYRYFRLRYRVVHWTLRALIMNVFGLRVRGAIHEQVAGALLYASNHVSWYDPPVIGSGINRELHFLAKSELFVGPFGWFISAFNAIPIVRRRWDPQAFSRAAAALRAGESLLIFPEGTRRPVGRPGPVKRGLGLLTRMAEVPFVPCYVHGTRSVWKALFRRSRLEVWMGPPLRLHAVPALQRSLSDGEINQRIGDLFLACIVALAERANRQDHGLPS